MFVNQTQVYSIGGLLILRKPTRYILTKSPHYMEFACSDQGELVKIHLIAKATGFETELLNS